MSVSPYVVIKLCLLRRSESNDTLVAVNLLSTQILVFKAPFFNKRNWDSPEKGLVPGLGQGKLQETGTSCLIRSKDVLEKDRRCVERMQEPTQRNSSCQAWNALSNRISNGW